VAFFSWLLVILSGCTTAWARGVFTLDVLPTRYGTLLALKIGLVTAVTLLAWWHQKTTLRGLTQDHSRGFVRWATLEVSLLLVAFGSAVWLARTPVPDIAKLTADPPHPQRYATIDGDLAPLTLLQGVFGVWSNPIAVTLTLALLAVGTWWVWPLRQPRLWVIGLLAWWCLAGGGAAYAPVVSWVYAARWVLLLVVVPALLAPVTKQVAPRLRPVDATLAMAATVLVVGHGVGLPQMLEQTAALWWLASLMVLALATLWWQSLGTTPTPERLIWAGLLALCQLSIAWRWAKPSVLNGWFEQVQLWWTQPGTDQNVGMPSWLLAAVLVIARAKTYPQAGSSDQAESTKTDHQKLVSEVV
jgi:hypothetical protein